MEGRAWRLPALAIALAGTTAVAHAEPTDPTEPAPSATTENGDGEERAPSRRRRAIAGTVAILPGFFVHGAGHFVLGETATGLRLLGMQVAALGAGFLTYRVLLEVGASVYALPPLVLLSVGALGLFASSYFADVFGVLVPEKARGDPLPTYDSIDLELGPLYVHDRVLAHRSFVRARVTGRWRRAFVRAELDAALNVRMNQVAGTLGYRFLERVRGASAGAFVEGSFTVRHRNFAHEGFALNIVEGFLLGRLPLRLLGPTLAGTFVEFGAGYGIEGARYRTGERDTFGLFLARTALGAWFGRGPKPRTEVAVYYEHRRDTLAGGIRLPNIPAAYLGFVGLKGDVWWTESWGFGAYAEFGTAVLFGALARYRYGARPW